ncbi:hypothetical protein [Streptomyces sp. NPDC096013]|uniref:hypothetical protein n=1 Tax=Streptomyces sp. NPDC096013 TaxID=3366069 RepID=UPI00381270C5
MREQQVIDSASWKSALLELFGGAWTFAAAGPRSHDDWRRDVQAVMTLKAEDPRNWGSLNFPPPGPNGDNSQESPFADLRLDEFDSLLYRVGKKSASQLLTALQGKYYQSSNIPDFESRKEHLFKCADAVLSRFSAGAAYYTNLAAARVDPDVELLNPDAEWNCISKFTTDCGLIVVSDSEVGVFWAFDED